MASKKGTGGRGRPAGSRAPPASDIEALVRRVLGQLIHIFPGGHANGVIILGVLVLAALGAWTAYYTVPSDSVAVVQRFGGFIKVVPPGLHFKLPLSIDEATIVPVKRQLKQEFGFTTPGAGDRFQNPRPGEPKEGNPDGDRRSECRAGGMGGAIPHF